MFPNVRYSSKYKLCTCYRAQLHYLPPSKPIRMHGKHYSLVWYKLTDFITGAFSSYQAGTDSGVIVNNGSHIRLLVTCPPTVDQQATDTLPTVGQHCYVDHKLTVNRVKNEGLRADLNEKKKEKSRS